MDVRVLAVLVLAGVAFAPLAAAQGHDHPPGSGFQLLSDLGETGTTYVGALNHFTILATGQDEVPDFHQDLPMRILLNDEPVFVLDDEAGHDYDGVRETWIAFGETGHYSVEALGAAGEVVAHLEGEVLAQPGGGAGFSGGSTTPLLGATEAEMDFHAHGSELPDRVGPRDYLMDTRLLTRLVASAPVRGEAKAAFTIAPQTAGLYQILATSFDAAPSQQSFPWPVSLSSIATVTTGGGDAPLGTTPALLVPPSTVNAVIMANGTGLRLIGMYDPWTSVGIDTLQQLGILALDPATNEPATDVTISAMLYDPLGRVLWQSNDGFAPSGWWSLSTVQGVPGIYALGVHAESALGSADIVLPYAVTPPAEPGSVGTIVIAVDGVGVPEAGKPMQLELAATDSRGTGFGHTDVVVDIIGPTPSSFDEKGSMLGVGLLLRTKVHAHADGIYRLTFVPPSHGTYTLLLTPTPLEARPIVLSSYTQDFVVFENPGPGVATGVDGEDGKTTPMSGVLALVALGAALVARRRA